MTLSVIIPAYNESEYLDKTLTKLISSVKGLDIQQTDWEIIVCDNNSTDTTSEIAKQHGAKVVFESENQISRARNKGAKIAKGEWLLFMDADTYPEKNLMTEIVNIIKQDKLIGCGVTVKVIDGSIFNKLRMERLNPFFRLLNIAGGAFILCKKEGFDSINGFSKNLFAYEEFDFIIRLKKYGKTVKRQFKVLYKNPVITSGRKGEFKIKSMSRLIYSNFIAIILFMLYYILPSGLIQRLGKKHLGFWYKKKENSI